MKNIKKSTKPIKKILGLKTSKRMKNKKNLVRVVTATLLVIVVIVVIMAFNTFVANNSDVSIKASADSTKSKAVILLNSNPTQSKKLLTEAREKYVSIKDTNNIVDVDALLYIIAHPNNSNN